MIRPYYRNKNGKLYNIAIEQFDGELSDQYRESVSLVITDPPYAKQYNYLWGHIGKLSSELLADGGSLITLHHFLRRRYWYLTMPSSHVLYRKTAVTIPINKNIILSDKEKLHFSLVF